MPPSTAVRVHEIERTPGAAVPRHGSRADPIEEIEADPAPALCQRDLPTRPTNDESVG